MLARDGRISEAHQQRMANAGLAVFAVVFLVYVLRTPLGSSTQALFRDYYTFPLVMGIAYVGLLLNVVLRPELAVGRLLSRPGIRFLGDISYSVYLLHLPIQYQWLVPLSQRFDGPWPVVVVLSGTVLVVLPLATLSFWFVERPFLRQKRRSPAPATLQAA